ncbi:MAG: hypothetical protein JXJ20_14170 [Anaerolineae bacterium]|nr:hypothetical protein [Anaerolineae bacterium]
MRITQRAAAILPEWARPGHPVLHAILQHGRSRRSRIERLLMGVGGAAVMIGLVWISYEQQRRGVPLALEADHGSVLFETLYFPLVIVQFLAAAVALLSTDAILARDGSDRAWETVKVSGDGGRLVVWARWAAVFYRLRWLLLVILLARFFLVGRVIAHLAGYEGYELHPYLDGIEPGVSVTAAVALLGALLIAALIQPVVMVGFSAALGLYFTAEFRSKQAASLLRLAVVLVELGAFGLVLLGADVSRRLNYGGAAAIVSRGDMLFTSLACDHSLEVLDLPVFSARWARSDGSILLGLDVLLAVMLIAALTWGLLRYTGWLVSRPAER